MTGAGPGYFKERSELTEDVMPRNEVSSSDKNRAARQVTKKVVFNRMRKSNGTHVKADFSVSLVGASKRQLLIGLEALRGFNRNENYVRGLQMLLEAIFLGGGEVMSITRMPWTTRPHPSQGTLVDLEYPLSSETEFELESLVRDIRYWNGETARNVGKPGKPVPYTGRLEIVAKFRSDMSVSRFLDGVVPFDGEFRKSRDDNRA